MQTMTLLAMCQWNEYQFVVVAVLHPCVNQCLLTAAAYQGSTAGLLDQYRVGHDQQDQED